MSSDIERRKDDHLALCATEKVAFETKSTLLECVHLVHNSLPELQWEEIDTRTKLLGKELRYPIVIAGMTGGTESAASVNRDLASLAERRGYAFGVGSQRAMDSNEAIRWTYEVREHAPQALVLGNMGAVQAKDMTTAQVEDLVRTIGADALCLHLNPAQELIQAGGDRDFRGCLAAIGRLQRELPFPVVAKETGAGMSLATVRRLIEVGVTTVDVSGAGGTSWVGVEALRAKGVAKAMGELFWDWGIPTGASVAWAAREGLSVIATGGIRTGLDVAKAIALGAHAVGIARGFYIAQQRGGAEALDELAEHLEGALRTAMLLTGNRTITELRKTPRVITGALKDWLGEGRDEP